MEIPEDIILPPADVREVIDKTAGYIHRNGSSFEQRMRERQGENKQFQFLFEHDAYYGYYSWRLNNYKEGKEISHNGLEPVVLLLEQILPVLNVPLAPRELEFYCHLTPMSSFDFDVLKMTAMLVAQNGGEYLQRLLKERLDLSLDFLQEDHSLHQNFKHFVSQFEKILNPSKILIDRILEKAKDPFSLLEECYQRLEFEFKLEKENETKLEELKREKLEFASIDWQDFVIVETIEIDDADKVSELPLPLSLADLQYRSLAQKKLHSLIEEAAPDEFVEKVQTQSPQQAPSPPQQQLQNQQHRSSRPVPKGMKIRNIDNSRHATNNLRKLTEERMVKSPFSNQMIPESKLTQHIEIAFRDPRYKEERRRYESKIQGSNLNTDDVLSNINRILSRKRDDDDGDNDNDDDEASTTKKKRKVQWDGYSSSAKYVVQEANKSISKKDFEDQRKREIDRQNKIGPH